MWVRSFTGWANIRAKKFHACDNSERATKIETELGQARIYVNDNRCSKKSSKQYLYKQIRRKREKCSTRHGKRAYPQTTDLNVPTAPRCDVEVARWSGEGGGR